MHLSQSPGIEEFLSALAIFNILRDSIARYRALIIPKVIVAGRSAPSNSVS